MRSMYADAGAAVAFSATAVTVVAAAFNAAWLAGHAALPPHRSTSRRVAALSLATLNAGIASQAALAAAMLRAHQLGRDTGFVLDSGTWMAARLFLLCGVLLLTALILRRPAR